MDNIGVMGFADLCGLLVQNFREFIVYISEFEIFDVNGLELLLLCHIGVYLVKVIFL